MEIQKITVKLSGLSDICFDRFIDHSKEDRPPEQKLYLIEDNQVVLPASNIISFLFAEKNAGCAKLFEGKKSGPYLGIGQGHVFIDPQAIPFTGDKGKPVIWKDFKGKFRILMEAGVTGTGKNVVKQEAKPRPVLILPWNLKFQITLLENTHIDSTKLYNWFVMGGIRIGLGNYRPRYGRFEVVEWKEK